jgi:outer membrane protein assembly factor BamB
MRYPPVRDRLRRGRGAETRFFGLVTVMGMAIVATMGSAFGQSSVAWVDRYPGGGFDAADAIVVSPDGSTVFATGDVGGGADTRKDIVTVAYRASTGERLWTAVYAAEGRDTPVDIMVAPDGRRVFVVGDSGDYPRTAEVVLAYDTATGDQAWLDDALGVGIVVAAALSPDGQRVYLTAGRKGSTWDWRTTALDASDGALVWDSTYDSGNPRGTSYNAEFPSDVAVTPDGHWVIVAGASALRNRLYGATAVAYDATSGADGWTSVHGVRHRDSIAVTVALTPDGQHAVIGGELDTVCGARCVSTSDAMAYSLDASTGELIWSEALTSTKRPFEWIRDAAISPDGGSAVLTGAASVGMGEADIDVATYDVDVATGDVRWHATYDGPGKRGWDRGWDVEVSPDGSAAYVAADSRAAGNGPSDIVLLGYGIEDGTLTAVDRYDGPASESDFPDRMALAPDGSRAFVAGQSTAGRYGLFTVVAYDLAAG